MEYPVLNPEEPWLFDKRDLDKPQKWRIWIHQGRKCVWCEQVIPFEYATIDHIWPLGQGGTNNIQNKVVACDQCNNYKGDLLPWEWEKILGRPVPRGERTGTRCGRGVVL